MNTRLAPLPTWFDRVAADWFGPAAPAFTPSSRLRVPSGPRVSARPSDTGLELRVELPGVAEQDIDLAVDGRVLTVSATHAESGERATLTRRLSIGEAYDLDAVEAHYANGLLTVRIPTVRPVSRRISITPAPAPAAAPAAELPADGVVPAGEASTEASATA